MDEDLRGREVPSEGKNQRAWVGSGGLNGAEVTATVFEELQELKGGVKAELLTWS